jgi:hypothetical protein
MASLRQIESARRNGAKSKGPITHEGKARSSRNATKHGFAAGHHVLVINEREDLYVLMLAEYLQNFQPANRVEADLVSRMVAAQWKMQRIDTAEAAMLDLQMDCDRPGIENEFNHIDEGTRLGIAFDGLANSGNGLALAGRYFSRAERTYTRALQNLRLLQRDRLRSE